MKIRFMVDYPHDKLQIVSIELPETVLEQGKYSQYKFELFREKTKAALQELFDEQGGYVQTEPEWTFENCNDEYPDDETDYSHIEVDDE